MAKLPPEFVKAASTVKPTAKRRSSKSSLVSEAQERDVREVMLRLTDDEYRALEQARDELRRSGQELTLEQMVHRVVAEWSVGARARTQVTPAPAPRLDSILDQLRDLARSPRESWRRLSVAMRRFMPA